MSMSVLEQVHDGPDSARSRYLRFITSCRTPTAEFCLTPRSDPSPYALCFAIFGLHLLQCNEDLQRERIRWDRMLRSAVALAAAACPEPARDKPYLQLLTFTLSALSILGTLDREPLSELVLPLLPADIELELRQTHALQGHARSGNHAMFMGVLLLHARDHLGRDTGPTIARWVDLHRQTMNCFGFWGTDRSMSHLQFQNGYHQYELFGYLETENVPWESAADAVAGLADDEGHFAPYPGGGGCYDYDAVFLLAATPASARRHSVLLRRTAATVLAEQNPDGGFCESLRVRPRSRTNLLRTLRHVRAAVGHARIERCRYGLSLLRPKHDRIHTHWSRYSREWGESDLWDAWFRMLTLARIECALQPERTKNWGFINYPGIGYHSSLRGAVQHGGTRTDRPLSGAMGPSTRERT
jgi:hypothetical protein